MGLYGVMLFVKDLPRMTSFYRDVVGLPPVEATRLPDWVEFASDGAGFSLHAIPPSIAAGSRSTPRHARGSRARPSSRSRYGTSMRRWQRSRAWACRC